MGLPVIVPRAEHAVSRKEIDADALRVLYRLHQNNYLAYLVGGSVRDLLLKRRPKDFDIGTSAHPYQVKRLFRNCWIIGRRFRLAHIRFGTKTIEVATFRRQVSAEELAALDAQPPAHGIPMDEHQPGHPDRLLHRDNTFGTPEEDAFRRDFTVNALFYDIGSFSIIDYTGGLRDLEARVIRCIGDPEERFQEDPGAHAARRGDGGAAGLLDRSANRRGHRETPRRDRAQRAGAADRRVLQAAARRRGRARLPHACRTPPAGADRPPAAEGRRRGLWRSLAALDAYRRRFEETPDTLTNAVLLGSLIVPLGPGGPVARVEPGRRTARNRRRRSGCCRSRAATSNGCARSSACSAG